MSLVNEHFLKLKSNYLFAGISDKIKAYKEQHPDADIISLGIGDVTQPLAPAVVEAIHRAADELAKGETFRGYGPEQGYEFLRKAIIQNDYEKRGVHLQLDEVFINDGAKSDLGNFQELIRWDNTIALTDPVYPAYVDANAMIGRSGIQQPDGRWSAVVYLPCNEDNKFVPDLPEQRVDIIYLCYPNNPTGTVLTKPQLQRWVNYAIKNDVLIFYDSAYEAFITDSRIPHSIYEIRGAEKVTVEFRSFSKTAGFTGVRCGYTVVPKDVTVATFDGERIPLNPLWKRRQSTKYNGTSYISQRAAEAVYSPEGRKQVRDTIAYYMRNAHYMCEELARMGFYVFGGQNAPYLWVKTPDDCDSWAFFDLLLQKANVVCTPGSGFGPSGEGFVRLTAFSTYEQTQKAIQRIKKYAT